MTKKENDFTWESLQRRVHILEMMSQTIKWVSEMSDDNDALRDQLADHDLTRLQMMELEREREDLKLLAESLRERLDMWRDSTLSLVSVLFDLERDGVRFTESQRDVLVQVLKESQSNE
jgi:hypothetical protein